MVFTLRDLPPSTIAMATLSWALDLARELFGEEVLGVWEEAMGFPDSEGSGGGGKGSEQGKKPEGEDDAVMDPFLSPAADSPLGALQSTPRLATLAQWLDHRPLRLCARRLIGVGNKETLVGGTAEGNLYREWAAEVRRRVGPPGAPLGPGLVAPSGAMSPFSTPPTEAAKLPILLIDRGQRDNGETVAGAYGRRFHNLEEMEGVLRKYGLSWRTVDDPVLRAMSFEEHVGLFNSAKLLIIAHSAGENNALFMPPRSAIIEVYGAQMWCPIYSKALSYAGHHVFPIYSNLNAPGQDYAFSYGKSDEVVS